MMNEVSTDDLERAYLEKLAKKFEQKEANNGKDESSKEGIKVDKMIFPAVEKAWQRWGAGVGLLVMITISQVYLNKNKDETIQEMHNQHIATTERHAEAIKDMSEKQSRLVEKNTEAFTKMDATLDDLKETIERSNRIRN